MVDYTIAETKFRAGRVFSRSISILFRNFVPFGLLALAISAPVYAYWVLARAEDSVVYVSNTAARILTVIAAEDLLANLVVAALVYGTIRDLKNDRASPGKCVSKGFALTIPAFGIAVVAAAITALMLLIANIPRMFFSEAHFEALAAAYESRFALADILLMVKYGEILWKLAVLIPASYVWVMLWAAIPVAVVEGRGLGALRRSMTLTRGYRWRVFFLLFFLGFVGFGARSLTKAANGAIDTMARTGAGAEFAYYTGQIAVDWLASAFVAALSAVVVTVSYHDLRAAKEGADTSQIAAVFD